MLSLELFEQLHFLLLIAGGQTGRFLPLVVHHFLYHAPRLTVQVVQSTVVWLYLAQIYAAMALHNARPPIHAVLLFQVNAHCSVLAVDLPVALVGANGVGQLAFNVRHAVDQHLDALVGDVAFHLSGSGLLCHGRCDGHLGQRLSPAVVWALSAVAWSGRDHICVMRWF